ncbi:MAG: hypothetical protein R6X32_08725, partial [Chloroflexota bacterium]
PWVFGLVKSASRLTPEQLEETGLTDTFGQMHLFLADLIGKGQQVGAIRSDLPPTLLISLLMAIDDALDHWLLEHWSTLTAAEMEQIAHKTLTGMQRLLQPQPDTEPLPNNE